MYRKRTQIISIKNFIALILIIVLLAGFSFALDRVSSSNSSSSLDILDQAVKKSITECYALEGTYPPNIAYLKDHYGLMYDENAYRIDYVYIGGNIRPDYTIIEKGE